MLFRGIYTFWIFPATEEVQKSFKKINRIIDSLLAIYSLDIMLIMILMIRIPNMWHDSKHWNMILGVSGMVHLPPVPFVVTDVLLRLAFSNLELPGVSPLPTRGWGLARSCISIDLLEQQAAEQKLKSQQWPLNKLHILFYWVHMWFHNKNWDQ